jgi:parallel beta-helix repeat protein
MLVGYCHSEVISVCSSGCNYTSIQSAVDAANSGDTIEVQNGTYNELVDIIKPLTLRGKNKGNGLPLVDANQNGSAITLSANGVILEGLNVTNSTPRNTSLNQAGIKINSDNNLLVNNTIFRNEAGILLINSRNNTIKYNKARENYFYGISLENSSNNSILNNDGDKEKIAINLNESKYNNISLNNLIDSGIGIYINKTSIGNNICDNIIFNNDYGLMISDNFYGNNTLCPNQTKNNSKEDIATMAATRIISPTETLSGAPIKEDGNLSNILSRLPVIGGKRIDVCRDGCDNTSIQSAVDYANPGDTIIVQNGTYHERVNITKPLILRGEGDGNSLPIIDADFKGNAITLSADGVTLERLNVTNATYPRFFHGRAGIKVMSNNNTILNITTFKNEAGILLIDSRNNTIVGINAMGNFKNGISLQNCSNNSILKNNVYHSESEDGILLVNSHNNTIAGNKASENHGSGLFLQRCNNNTILENVASLNEKNGISLVNSQNNTILGNNATFNKNIGLNIESSTGNLMRNNSMWDNLYNFDASDGNYINTTNLVNGKKIYYLMDARDKEINSSYDAGTVYCIRCDNVTIKDLMLNNTKNAIYLFKTTNTIIENNTFYNNYNSIYINSSDNIIIARNNLIRNQLGLFITRSSLINTTDNNFTLNQGGLQIESSIKNNLCRNNFTSREDAYDLIIPTDFSINNTICLNQTNDLKNKYIEETNNRTVGEESRTYGVSSSSDTIVTSHTISYAGGSVGGKGKYELGETKRRPKEGFVMHNNTGRLIHDNASNSNYTEMSTGNSEPYKVNVWIAVNQSIKNFAENIAEVQNFGVKNISIQSRVMEVNLSGYGFKITSPDKKIQKIENELLGGNNYGQWTYDVVPVIGGWHKLTISAYAMECTNDICIPTCCLPMTVPKVEIPIKVIVKEPTLSEEILGFIKYMFDNWQPIVGISGAITTLIAWLWARKKK